MSTRNPLNLSIPENAPYIDFTREFDHPVEKVFAAYADASTIAQWLGPRELESRVDHYDFRTGGSYAYTHIDPTTKEEYSFRGSLHSVRENEIAIQTFEFLGFPDAVSMEALRFEALGTDRCRISSHSVFDSQEARDGIVESDMETGTRESFDRLDELLEK